MVYLLAGVAALAIFFVFARAFAAASPHTLVGVVRYAVGVILIVIGAFLALAERWGIALPLIAAGISALSVGRIGPIDLGGGRRSAGSSSTVRSPFLEMRLDHDTGAMSGQVLGGAYAGKSLDNIPDEELPKLYREVAVDEESRALLEAYLDRRIPGWREDFEADAATGPRRAPQTGPMTDEEAYQILGLAPGADESEIRAAHRRLMMKVHPDQGGSTFLAAKINEAKDRLLSRHG